MKKAPFIFTLILIFLAEIILCLYIIGGIKDSKLDVVTINECVKSVESSFPEVKGYSDLIPYTVLDNEGNVIYQNDEGLASSLNEGIQNGDMILDIEKDGHVAGKIIFHNDSAKANAMVKQNLILVLIIFSVIQFIVILSCLIYLKKNVLDPFEKLNGFAIRIAGGNLDIPLDVDKKHIFGSFTEAFDIMRSELKKARIAEKKANDEKKEVIAKLSHDIKTPVASIKSSSEVGYELTKEEKSKDYFQMINEKADQIKELTDNLFNNAVNDVAALTVSPARQPSDTVRELIKNADYRKKAVKIEIPSCEVFFDKLRLQQVFDNIFTNSYKYADTAINVRSEIIDEYLVIEISDEGGGVKESELPLLKEKYKRGSNSSGKDGAGLGLYLSDHFIDLMDGKLEIESKSGFTVRVFLRTI